MSHPPTPGFDLAALVLLAVVIGGTTPFRVSAGAGLIVAT
jgi:hypothetical protein